MKLIERSRNALMLLRLYPFLFALSLYCTFSSVIIFAVILAAILFDSIMNENPIFCILGVILFFVLSLFDFIIMPIVFEKPAIKKFQKDLTINNETNCDKEKTLSRLQKLYRRGRNGIFSAPVAAFLSTLLLSEDRAQEATDILEKSYRDYSCTENANTEIFATVCASYLPALLRTDRDDEAQTVYSRFLSLCENDENLMKIFSPVLSSAKMNFNIMNGLYDEAEEYCKNKISEDDTGAEKYLLAKIYHLQGRKEEAAPLFRVVIKESSDKYIIRKSKEYLGE